MCCIKTFVLFAILIIVSKSEATEEKEGKEAKEEKKDGRWEGFIVGGRFADILDFPHSAYLAISCLKATFEDFACGASIVNQVVLLTAAHCYDNCLPGTKTSVSVGDANKNRKQLYQVKQFANHPQYDANLMKNDIALAFLAQPLTFSRAVKRVILSKVGIYNEPAMLAGWGVTDETYNTDTIFLKTTRQRVWSRQKCLSALPQLEIGYICGTAEKSKDSGYAAVGDSGSALVVRGYIQIGVVSHKVTDVSTSLIVYTDVPYFYEWIVSTSKSLYCRNKL